MFHVLHTFRRTKLVLVWHGLLRPGKFCSGTDLGKSFTSWAWKTARNIHRYAMFWMWARGQSSRHCVLMHATVDKSRTQDHGKCYDPKQHFSIAFLSADISRARTSCRCSSSRGQTRTNADKPRTSRSAQGEGFSGSSLLSSLLATRCSSSKAVAIHEPSGSSQMRVPEHPRGSPIWKHPSDPPIRPPAPLEVAFCWSSSTNSQLAYLWHLRKKVNVSLFPEISGMQEFAFQAPLPFRGKKRCNNDAAAKFPW